MALTALCQRCVSDTRGFLPKMEVSVKIMSDYFKKGMGPVS